MSKPSKNQDSNKETVGGGPKGHKELPLLAFLAVEDTSMT